VTNNPFALVDVLNSFGVHPVTVMIKSCIPAKEELCVLIALDDALMVLHRIAFIFYFFNHSTGTLAFVNNNSCFHII
jgi:hypothetical protein